MFRSRIGAMCIAAALAISMPAPALAGSGSLDGKSFKGKIGEDDDTFTFKQGRFDSEACHEFGYGDSSYSTTAGKGNGVTFDARTSTKAGDSIVWSGTVVGRTLTGTAVRRDPDGKVVEKKPFQGTAE